MYDVFLYVLWSGKKTNTKTNQSVINSAPKHRCETFPRSGPAHSSYEMNLYGFAAVNVTNVFFFFFPLFFCCRWFCSASESYCWFLFVFCFCFFCNFEEYPASQLMGIFEWFQCCRCTGDLRLILTNTLQLFQSHVDEEIEACIVGPGSAAGARGSPHLQPCSPAGWLAALCS